MTLFSTSATLPPPRLPLVSWRMFAGARKSSLPSIADHGITRLTTSGRSAIALSLKALGVRAGERVLLPTYHCPTMIAPTVKLGATPLFYPLNEHGGARLEWLQRQDLRGVKAMLAAHFFGIPQPMRALRELCDAHGIALIEDCAHAFFGMSEGRSVGGWGDCAIASLTKFFPVSEGGVLVTRRARLLPVTTRRSLKDEIRALLDALEIAARHGALPGANLGLSAVFAIKRLLRRQAMTPPGPATRVIDPTADPELAQPQRALTHTAFWLYRASHQARIVRRRRAHYGQLVALLDGQPGLRALMPRLPTHCAPYVMPLWVDAPDAPYHALREAGIPVFRWCLRWPDTPRIDHDAGPRWSRHVLQLGCHQDLSERHIFHIADTVKRLCA